MLGDQYTIQANVHHTHTRREVSEVTRNAALKTVSSLDSQGYVRSLTRLQNDLSRLDLDIEIGRRHETHN